MIEQTKDCETCYGTGNEPRMISPEPGRKILFRPCPACAGTGKTPLRPGAEQLRLSSISGAPAAFTISLQCVNSH